MADNKICFSDVKMAGNAGNTEIITAADKTVLPVIMIQITTGC